MNGTIYIIKNVINDMVYVGQTSLSIQDRFKQHLNHSKSKSHYKLYKAMNELGKENFYIESLEDNINIDDLDSKEKYWINIFDSYNHGYNSNIGGRAKHENKIRDIDIVLNLLSNGMSVGDVGKELEVHTMTINRALKASGYETASHYRKDGWMSECHRSVDRDSVKDLYLKGLSHYEIAKELNINQRTVSRIVKELSINKRKMIDYNSIDLNEFQKDYESYKNGLIKKKELNQKYGLNQNSLKIIEKMLNKTN